VGEWKKESCALLCNDEMQAGSGTREGLNKGNRRRQVEMNKE